MKIRLFNARVDGQPAELMRSGNAQATSSNSIALQPGETFVAVRGGAIQQGKTFTAQVEITPLLPPEAARATQLSSSEARLTRSCCANPALHRPPFATGALMRPFLRHHKENRHGTLPTFLSTAARWRLPAVRRRPRRGRRSTVPKSRQPAATNHAARVTIRCWPAAPAACSPPPCPA